MENKSPVGPGMYGLPHKVEFCSECVISNQKPISSIESQHSVNHQKKTTTFTNGVCDACRWAEAKKTSVDWQQREEELQALCDMYRKKNGEHDVIVPASGGKDSRYVSHLLKHKYQMNPLTVTWRPHLFTQIGLDNFFSLIDTGFANVMVSPPGDVQRKLTRLAFKNLGHPFQPFIVGQRSVGPKLALQTNIKLVFYGENVAEYGNRIEDNYSPLMDARLYTCFDFHKHNLEKYILAGETLAAIVSEHEISLRDLESYKSPSLSEVETAGIQVHYMSYYRKWVPQENYYYAVENTNFVPNSGRKSGSFAKYAGIDDQLEDLHFYMQLIKFGMGRCTWDAAQEVRTGKLERHEAVSLVRKYDCEAPTEHLDALLDYLSFSEQEFWETVDSFRPRHLWTKDASGQYSLTEPVS
tara:strand:- start:249 stop:1481 length:1233 start_codon:yes stop_codon:yes gene_type:complete